MIPGENFFQKKIFVYSAFFLLFLICIAYSNHFTNGFEFDDSHSIVNNIYIRDIKNIPLFFTDVKYQGTNPGNQDYRPVVATFHAIDYWLGDGLNSVYFHIDIFFFYILQLVLMFFMIRKIFDISLPSNLPANLDAARQFTGNNSLFALLITGFYGLHAANAETINYICMRSDSFCTLSIIASFLLYFNSTGRKYFLYLITLLIAIGAKENGVMFGPILFFYILFFVENVSLTELVTFKKPQAISTSFIKALPALIFAFGVFYLRGKFFFPPSSGSAESSHVWNYFYTQWVVIIHYIGNFILPLNLSVDTTFILYDSVINQKVLLSLAVILLLIFLAFITSIKKETRPIAFGILWFFIALAPTSSFIPFGQISNDHRTFFPYIGLVISLGWWLRLLYMHYEEKIFKSKHIAKALFSAYLVIIGLHAFGTYQRNNTWGSSEELWHDAAIKGPENGRAQMNYGLTLMSKAQYDEAYSYFKRTLELNPYWAYIHINMGILREAMGFHEEAEQYFQNAIKHQPFVPDGYYFYARWLHGKERLEEAIEQLKKGKEISPGHNRIIDYLNNLLDQQQETPEIKISRVKKIAGDNPSSANFIELSLVCYQQGKYPECIEACKQAIQLDPKSAVAYNNMCSAYNAIKQWKDGVAACSKALEIDPEFQLAKNNLNWAKENLR